MKNLVTGIYRSGSTWLFNAVRLVSNEIEGVEHESLFYQSGDLHFHRHEHCIVKTHAYYPDIIHNFYAVFVSSRSKDGVLDSMHRTAEKGLSKGYENAGDYENIDKYMSWLELWKDKADYVMDFDRMVNDPELIVSEIAEILDKKVNTDKIMRQLDAMSAPANGHDPVTFMSEAHYKFIK